MDIVDMGKRKQRVIMPGKKSLRGQQKPPCGQDSINGAIEGKSYDKSHGRVLGRKNTRMPGKRVCGLFIHGIYADIFQGHFIKLTLAVAADQGHKGKTHNEQSNRNTA